MNMDKEYRPEEVERRWSEEWAKAGLFVGRPESGKPPFCMVIPPPNVTGNLHIGHVLVYTLHDVVARWQRMRGADVLWLPGTDHAGIATQMVVERELKKDGRSRHDLGREAFEERVWEWKDTYGGNIIRSLKGLGSSVDWTRERFTLDEGLSRAVRTVFVQLYEQGLIYRDRYIVNWCPRCRTALSDLETESRPVAGKLWTLRYVAADGGDGEIRVATTRPETLLGDTGVAVHPEDERYAALIDREVRVPLVERAVPVKADAFVDPEFGTGAVKVTPAHDPNDFEAGRRLGLEQIEVIDAEGKMTDAAGVYRGLDRFEARERVLEDLEQQGLLVGVKPHEHAVGHCQRCGTVVEPRVSTQWFVKAEVLAKPAIEAVETGRTRFYPETWSKVYFEWMRNIHDWCISRQLWWGHRIPAWYCDACEELFVASEAPPACKGCGGELRQDDDVLDTWFSSALWPFSTLGWPERTPDLEHYYPTSLLITGHDIIFFWVARMMMMGLHFMQDVPFREVYIHGLVRDERGEKMSKSKGNTVDPEVVHDEYGTDAVRFTMAILAAPGNDIPLAPKRMEGYRAFANKLWNATRFVLMKLGDEPGTERLEELELSLADRWVLSRTQRTIEEVSRALAEYRFDRAADLLYHFAWHEYCDWYIEFVKPDFPREGEAPGERFPVARAVLLESLNSLLRLLHPFMPFLTEELWHKLPGTEGFLAVADWPEGDPARIDPDAERDLGLVQELAAKIRNLRAEAGIQAGQVVDVLIQAPTDDDARLIREQAHLLSTLVRAGSVTVIETPDEGRITARAVLRDLLIQIPLEGVLDLDAARTRLRKDLTKVARELEGRTRKLSNSSFLEKAPPEVIAEARAREQELLAQKTRLEETLASLGGEAGSP